MKQYIQQLERMYTGPKIEISEYKSGSILKSELSDSENLNDFTDSPMKKMLEKVNQSTNNTSAENTEEVKDNSNAQDEDISFDFDKSGLLGFYGTGNVQGSFETNEKKIKANFGFSLFDTNKAFRDKGSLNTKVHLRQLIWSQKLLFQKIKTYRNIF